MRPAIGAARARATVVPAVGTRALLLVLAGAAVPAPCAPEYADVDAYVAATAGPGARVLSDRHGGQVYGVAQWICSDGAACATPGETLAMLFVLHGTGTGLSEEARSAAFVWQASAKTPVLDAVEARGPDRFEVSLHRFAPVGRQVFSFARQQEQWRLAGMEVAFLTLDAAQGDEAVGDSVDSVSVDYPGGRIVHAVHRNNRPHARRECPMPPRELPLAVVDLFAADLAADCPSD